MDYTHFYGSYWTYAYAFGWYKQEVRVVRRDSHIRSVGDAQGFRGADNAKLRVKKSGGHYFHYGHALSPEQAKTKRENFLKLYGNDEAVAREIENRPSGFYDEDQKVKPFKGTHPAVMREIVAVANWTYAPRCPLIRLPRKLPALIILEEDVALIFKRLTGITVGVHKNYTGTGCVEIFRAGFMLLSPTHNLSKLCSFFLGRLWQLAKPYRVRLFMGVAAGIISGLISPLLIATIMFVFGAVFPTEKTSTAYTLTNNAVAWPAITLPNGGSTNFTVSLNTATNSLIENVKIKTSTPSAANVFVFLSGATKVGAGNNSIYTIVVTNSGPLSASNVMVSARFSDQSCFCQPFVGSIAVSANAYVPAKLVFRGACRARRQ